MFLANQWLKSVYGIDLPTKEIANKLTMAGLEVDGIENDVLEINLTPNRTDCFSVKGLVRELSVLFAIDNINPSYPDGIFLQDLSIDCGNQILVDNQEINICPLYFARVISNINNQIKTPQYISDYLTKMGVGLNNIVVDILNFVMLEIGAPMHAFDKDKIKEKIIIRKANNKEKITLLNNQIAELDDNFLVIADEEKALAVAGVIGGLDSSCDEQTKTIVLESAWFNPISIAGKARILGVASESAQRFERGVDFELQKTALDWASFLISHYCGGVIHSITKNINSDYLPKRTAISLNKQLINDYLGKDYLEDEIINIFNKLFCLIKVEKDYYQITPPSWRFDLNQDVDLIEEIARIDGYHNIENKLPVNQFQTKKADNQIIKIQKLRQKLINKNLNEIISYSFIDPSIQKSFFAEQKGLVLQNPISSQLSEMRLSLIPSLVQTALYNINRQNNDLQLFELGTVFIPTDDKAINAKQITNCGILFAGRKKPENWLNNDELVDYYDLKAVVESCFDDNIVFRRPVNPISYLHQGQSAEIVIDNQVIGVIGSINPELSKKLGFKNKNLLVAEFNSFFASDEKVIQFKEFSKFPSVRRDLALVVDRDCLVQDLLNFCQDFLGDLCVESFCFDQFIGGNLPSNKKSLALAFVLQDTKKTLQDEDVASTIGNLLDKLNQQFGAILRV